MTAMGMSSLQISILMAVSSLGYNKLPHFALLLSNIVHAEFNYTERVNQ